MQKYSTYKPSHVEWLGDVPSHWKVDRLRDIALVNSETLGSDTPNEYQLRYIDISNVNYNGVISFDAIETLEYENAPSRAKRITRKNDTIVSSVRPNLQAVCYIDFNDTNLICSTGFNVMRTRNEILDSRFLFYCLISDVSKDFFVSRANGVGYPAIGDYDFGSLKIAFPIKTEQTAIATYLDLATANIDKVIATKQQQLEKLEQYKQSKIHECVTKGINPDVTLKPSGIDWIGDVPSHWKVEKIKRRMSFVYGSALKEEDRIDGEFNVYGSNGIVGTHELPITDGETIIIGRKGTAGALNYSYEPCYPIDTAYFIDKNATELNIRFLFYALQTLDLDKMNEDSAVPGLSRENAYQKQLAFPPKAEQKELAEYLDDFTNKISHEKNIIEQQIEKLKQYRKCLIHECVTGKRKVIND
jgi:type I restriction enzyme S subunit